MEGKKIAVAGATGRVGRHVVDVLESQGHDVIPVSRSHGLDVTTGMGLAAALEGVESVVDAATGPSPDEQAATEFFTAAAGNLQQAAEHAGVRHFVVVSIVGTDRFGGGYGAAKLVQEQAYRAGSIPARIVRATQFHEFVEQLVDWGRQDGVSYVPRMRTQLVAARSVAEILADLAAGQAPTGAEPPIEVAGPRPEILAEMARLLVAGRGESLRIEEVSDPSDPTQTAYASGALLPGPDAILTGPTFVEWLETAGVPAGR